MGFWILDFGFWIGGIGNKALLLTPHSSLLIPSPPHLFTPSSLHLISPAPLLPCLTKLLGVELGVTSALV
jgi:hypothetical protein